MRSLRTNTPHKVTRTYFARFWPPLWHSSGYRAIAGYGWKRKLCSLFSRLFFQADTPKTCTWREKNLPSMFVACSPDHFLKPLLPKIPAHRSYFCWAKKGVGKAHALPPDGTGVPCSWQMGVRVGFEPPRKDPAISLNRRQCPVPMHFDDIAGRFVQPRDVRGHK